jgi:hypothetical protein
MRPANVIRRRVAPNAVRGCGFFMGFAAEFASTRPTFMGARRTRIESEPIVAPRFS